MGSIVLYIIEWAFALLVLLAIYKAAFSGTTLHRFNRFYLLGATLLSALLPLVHVTIPDSTPLVSEMSIQETEFAQELSGTFMFAAELGTPIAEPYIEEPASKSQLWPIMLVCAYAVYVLTLIIGWSRGIIRARRFLKGKPRHRLSRTVWLVTHDGSYGPFSWMNYIVISNNESGFARRASLRHEYSHVRLMHSIDLIVLLACTIVNPVCWLVLQEIKIVHEFEADDEVINRYGIQEQDYQRLLLIRTVGAEAYALASSFNLNIKKRIIMMNKNKTRKRRLMWLLLLIPLLGMTSVLFARTEKALNIEIAPQIGTTTVKGKVIDEKGKPIANAIISESRPGPAVGFKIQGFTDKNGDFSFNTVEMDEGLYVTKEGYGDAKVKDYYNKNNLVITLQKGGPRNNEGLFVKQRNLMRMIVKSNGKVHVMNGLINKDVEFSKLKDIIRQFIVNPKNDSKLPVHEEYEIFGFKTEITTLRYVLALEREAGASLENRDAVYGVVMSVLYDLRNEWCLKKFGTSYAESTQQQQEYARAVYPNKVTIPEVRYFCDLNLRIRKSAILAQKELTDQYSDQPVPKSQEEEGGTLLGVILALEQYLDKITADGQTLVRTVEIVLGANADDEFVQEVKEVLRKRNIINIKYLAEPQRSIGQYSLMIEDGSEEPQFSVMPQTLKAGDIIKGIVTDADSGAPIMLAELFELDAKDRILAHGITDNNGAFSIRITDPNNSLKISANGYLTTKRPIANGLIQLRKDANDEIFQGRTPETVQYIQDNINYPDEAKQNPNSNVLVSFTAGKDGNVMNPEIIGSNNPALDEEALKVLSQMPAWIPARNENGEAVEVKYTIPVSVPTPSE